MKLPVLIISKLASLRDLERACFVCINISTQPGLQSEHAVVAHIHREAAEFLWETEAAGATPLCKQLTLVVIQGWGPVESPCSPGMVPLGQGRREVDSLKKQCGDRTRTFRLHLSLSPQQRSGRWGRARDRWTHPPPAGTATSICPQLRQLFFLLVIAAQTAHSLHFLSFSLIHHSSLHCLSSLLSYSVLHSVLKQNQKNLICWILADYYKIFHACTTTAVFNLQITEIVP